MTEMVYGSIPIREGEPVLPRWWRTIDKWSLTGVFILFGIGILLGTGGLLRRWRKKTISLISITFRGRPCLAELRWSQWC